MNKKGEAGVELSTKEIIEIFIAFIVVGVFIYIGLQFFRLSGFVTTCENEVEWSQVKSTLIQSENPSFTNLQISFQNKDCHLVTFSEYQQGKIFPDPKYPINKNPMVCLCKIEKENRCKAYACYKFTKYKNIESSNQGQFETSKEPVTMFLTFNKEGDTLKVSKI